MSVTQRIATVLHVARQSVTAHMRLALGTDSHKIRERDPRSESDDDERRTRNENNEQNFTLKLADNSSRPKLLHPSQETPTLRYIKETTGLRDDLASTINSFGHWRAVMHCIHGPKFHKHPSTADMCGNWQKSKSRDESREWIDCYH